MKTFSVISLLYWLFFSAPNPEKDLLVHNATIYTVDKTFSKQEAMLIRNGRIIATGKLAKLRKNYPAAIGLDAKGGFIYPGIIDAHAHFGGYGLQLQVVDLNGSESWDECLQRIIAFNKTRKIESGEWVLGRGWDQNDWDKKEFPGLEKLDELFPSNPVLLTRVDGHAAIANSYALKLAGVKPGQTITGGDIMTENGKLTGMLIDNAIELVSSHIPAPSAAEVSEALINAQQNCFAKGITTVDDCGVGFEMVELMDSLHRSGELKMKLYAMLSDHPLNYDYIFKKGRIKTDRLHVRAFKVYADGALGSRGACLLEPYSDKPETSGFLLSEISHFDSVANILYKKGLQMCTHAIGDSGNRVILNTYARYLKGKNDLRWRIEHAQVVNEKDFSLFGKYSIIPSVQPTQATSDMYWAGERLGKEREKGAYAFKRLMQENGYLPLGTDFPVEDIDPLKTFLAAVVRKDNKGWPEGGYQMENALSREEAIRGMTIWAAKSNFEESEKGSLEKGKFADFIILNRDLMTVPPSEILNTKVMMTFVNGEKVYENK